MEGGISLLNNTYENLTIGPGERQTVTAEYVAGGAWSFRRGDDGSWTNASLDKFGTAGNANLIVNSLGSETTEASADLWLSSLAYSGEFYQVRYGVKSNYQIFNFTVSTGQTSATYPVYFYTLIPGKEYDKEVAADEIWNGMGLGSVSGLNDPGSYDAGENLFDIAEGSIVFPGNYPSITYEGQTYTYAASDSGHEYDKGYYTIEWVSLVTAAGANAGANGYNEPVSSDTRTFHCNGQVTLNQDSLHTVSWLVKEPGNDGFVIQTDYSKLVPDGTSEAALAQPSMEDKTYNGIIYTLDGWYTDESCSTKVKFTDVIKENKKYYAQYVVKSNDVLTYCGNGATGGATAPTEGVTGKEVTVAHNGYERFLTADGHYFRYDFAGWNTKADGEGKDYNEGSDYKLTNDDDVLYAQWEGESYLQYDLGVDVDKVIWENLPSSLIRKYKVNGVNTGNPVTIGESNNYYLDSERYSYEEEVSIPKKAPQRDGYTFIYWDDGENTYNPGESLGYPYNEDKKGDDSLTLKAVWKENTADVTYSVDNEAAGKISNSSDTIGQVSAAGLEGSTATANLGYKFIGWYVGNDMVSDNPTLSVDKAKDKLNKDTKGLFVDTDFTAKFEPMDTEYTVEFYYMKDGKYSEDATESVKRTGKTGERASVKEEDKTSETAKHTFDEKAANVLDGVVAGDGSTVLKVYFKQQLTVSYVPGDHGSFEQQTTSALDYGSVTPAFTGTLTGEAGYTFAGWNPKVAETVTSDVTYIAQWVPNEDVTYRVERYLQKLDGSYPETADFTDTETTGTTGENVEADTSVSYPGFTFDADYSGNVLEGTIVGDGSLVLKVYYERNSYEVSYSYGEAPAGATELPATSIHKFGETVNVANPASAPGYTFSGWTTQDVAVENGSFGMPAGDVHFIGTWTLNNPDSGDSDNDRPDQKPDPDPSEPEDPNPDPEDPDPEQPENPDPEEPEDPDPDNPEQPEDPDQPDDPDTPDNPDTPDQPDNPDNPDTSDTPDQPSQPDTPATPDTPVTPSNPTPTPTPSTPTPATPDRGYTPADNDTPTDTAVPADNDTPTDDGTTPDEDTATPEETIADDDTPLAGGETIEDEGTPLASAEQHRTCWTHWLMLVGLVASAAYFVVALVHRKKFTADLKSFEDSVLDPNNRKNA